jgi:hypothetical protein
MTLQDDYTACYFCGAIFGTCEHTSVDQRKRDQEIIEQFMSLVKSITYIPKQLTPQEILENVPMTSDTVYEFREAKKDEAVPIKWSARETCGLGIPNISEELTDLLLEEK